MWWICFVVFVQKIPPGPPKAKEEAVIKCPYTSFTLFPMNAGREFGFVIDKQTFLFSSIEDVRTISEIANEAYRLGIKDAWERRGAGKKRKPEFPLNRRTTKKGRGRG